MSTEQPSDRSEHDSDTVRARAEAQWVPRERYTPGMWAALNEMVEEARSLGLLTLNE